MNTEEWRPIPGWEELYAASSWGRIKSFDRWVTSGNRFGTSCRRLHRGKVLKPKFGNRGYWELTLSRTTEEGVQTKVSARFHLLVLETFKGARPGPALEIDGCHNDGNTDNNSLENLRWASRSENNQDKVAHGTAQRGEKGGRAVLTEGQVLIIRAEAATGARGVLRTLSERFGVAECTISAIKHRRIWKHLH